jgi:hypothetical protein
MANRLTTLEKVYLFKITLSLINDYDPYLKPVLPLLLRLYFQVLTARFSCPEAAACAVELENMINKMQQNIKKQDNYQAVIKQLPFYPTT